MFIRNKLLLEALQLKVIILENRIDYLRQHFLPRMKARLGDNGDGIGIPPIISTKLNQQQGEDTAEKLFNYVLSVDPDPVKKNSQWLLVQVMRNQNPMPLEDLENAGITLEKFAEMKKARLIPKEKSDINAYKSLSELNAVMRGENEQRAVVSQNEEQVMLAQCDVYVNDSNLLFLHPKTQEAAGYFGREADWCTAYGHPAGRYPDRTDNQFDYYNSLGPLYIILDKEKNEWYQFHFEANQFMNSKDIDVGSHGMVAILKKFPIIFKMIGEEKFIKFAQYLGLSFFSPATIAKFPTYDLASFIKSKADLKLIPSEKLTDLDFVEAVCAQAPEAIKWFPKNFVLQHGHKIAKRVYHVFKFLPAELQTQEFADELVGQRAYGYRWIEDIIPKHLQNSEVIQDAYWSSKITTNNLHMKDVPEKYKATFVVQVCKKHPEDIKDNEALIDQKKAIAIMQGNIQSMAFMPEKYLNEYMVKPFEEKLDNSTTQYTHRYGTNNPMSYWLRFKPEIRPKSAVKWLVENDKIKKFVEIPEDLRTVDILTKFIKYNKEQCRVIPQQYWTPKLFDKLIDNYGDLLKYINPEFVPEDILISKVAKKSYDNGLDEFFFSHLPKVYKTERLVAAFVDKGYVPIKEIPKSMMTEANVLKRIANKPEEASNIPPKMLSYDFAIRMVVANPTTITSIPEKYYSERLLYAWLAKTAKNSDDAYNYNHSSSFKEKKKIFEKFPKTMWSSRTLAIAISQHYLEASSKGIPDNLIDKNVASAIVAINHDEMDHLSSYLLDHEDKITNAVLKNWRLIKKLPLDKITEPMAFAIMEKFAHSAHSLMNARWRDDEDVDMRDTLLLIPKNVWSKRVYQEAVGQIITLKEVPAKWRDDEMAINAVNRTPDNIRYIPNSADWLNKNKGSLHLKSIQTPLEAVGFPLIRGKFVDTRALDKKSLTSGDSYTVIKSGPQNVRVYFFDKKMNFLFYLFTKDGKVELTNDELKKAKKYRDDVLQVAKAELTGFKAGMLNILGIYETRGNYRTEEQTSKSNFEGLQYTDNDHLDGDMFVIWNKVGKKEIPAIRMHRVVTKGAWGHRGNNFDLGEVTIYNKAFAIQNSKKIADFINKEVHLEVMPYSAELADVGIYFTKENKWSSKITVQSIASQKIGTIGRFTIYRNDNKIGLFNEDGMIASAVIRAKGNVDKVELARKYRYDDDEKQEITTSKIENMFNKISAVLEKNKDTKNISLEEQVLRKLAIV